MLSARFRKFFGDLRAERGRLGLMFLAVFVSLTALGAVLGAWMVLTREIGRSYLETNPAHATLELPHGLDKATLELVRSEPSVAEAEAREVTVARVHVGRDWRPLLLFTLPDFEHMRMNRFTRVSGAWPPPPGTILIERSAIGMAQAGEGESLEVKAPHGAPTRVPISGVVHDPGLAPAWQERSVYGYVNAETLRMLEGDATLHELRVRFRQEPATASDADSAAQKLGQWLASRGVAVHELRVPPPRQHPHQRQMVTVLSLLVIFGGLALLLSCVLLATSLSALLARQVREIGVMKTLGARTRQIAWLYVLLVLGLGTLAVLLSIPAGVAGAGAWTGAIADMLNFEIVDGSVPGAVWLVQLAGGTVTPLVMAWGVIRGAARTTVRSALDAHEVTPLSAAWSARLPPALRNLLRRPKRTALTLLLLATGGALFTTALSVAGAWDANLAKMQTTRHYDVEVRLHEAPPAALDLTAVRGVAQVEWWGHAPAAFAVNGRIDSVRTYPDRGHGSLTLQAPPPKTSLISLPLLNGRWLSETDDAEVVLNHLAAAQRQARVGDEILVSAEGQVARVEVVGIVEEIGAAGVVYLSKSAFERRFGKLTMARVTSTATSPQERERVIARVEQELARAGAAVSVVLPFAELRTAVGDHVMILVRALVALASVLGCVGLLGLSSAMSAAVIERTREIGVMKAVGANRRRILRLILSEGAFVSLLSAAFAALLALPLSAIVEDHLGRLGFMAPLPFVVSSSAAAGWLLLAVVAGLLATWLPARRASRISVREAIGYV